MERILGIVRECGGKAGQAKFMEWFLGDEIAVDETEYKYLFTGKRRLSDRNRKVVINKNTWKYSDLGINEKEYTQKVSEFVNQEFKISGEGMSSDELMSYVLKMYLFGTVEPENKFSEFQVRNCQNYLETPEEYREIDTAFKKSNIVILYGIAGMGKTQLAKGYALKYSQQYDEICVVEGEGRIEEKLEKIQFCINVRRQIDEIIRVLANKSERTLAIVDIPKVSASDRLFIEKTLSNLKMRFIITTLNRGDLKSVVEKNVGPLSISILFQIFIKNSELNERWMTDSQFEKLLKIIDYNICTLVLLAKCLKRKILPVEQLIDEREWIWNKTRLSTVHMKEYNQPTAKSPIYHILDILERYGVYGKEYAELSIWCKNNMKVDILKRWCSDTAFEKIHDSIEWGLIEYTDYDEKIIKMHSLLADALWKRDRIEFKDYKCYIAKFFEDIQWGKKKYLDFFELYDVMYNIFQRYNFEFKEKRSTKNIGNCKIYRKWLFDAIEFSIQSGNYYGTEALIYFWNQCYDKEKNTFYRLKENIWMYEISASRGDLEETYKYAIECEKWKVKQCINENLEVNIYLLDYLMLIIERLIKKIRVFEENREEIQTLLKYISKYNFLLDQYDKCYHTDEIHSYYLHKEYYQSAKINMIECERYYEGILWGNRKLINEGKNSLLELKKALDFLYWYFRFSIEYGQIKRLNDYEQKELSKLDEMYQGKIWPLDVEILYDEVNILWRIFDRDKEGMYFNLETLFSDFKSRLNIDKVSPEFNSIEKKISEMINSPSKIPTYKK